MENLENVFYKFKFKSKILNFKEEKLTEAQLRILFDTCVNFFIESGSEYQSIVDSLNSFKDRLGFGGFSKDTEVEFFCEAYRERIPCNTPHNCPERSLLQGEEESPKDDWHRIGEYRVCSYCGSVHPEDLVDAIGKYGMGVLESSTKGYKLYIRLPGVVNASLGPIKYYRWHDTPEFQQFVEDVAKEAKKPSEEAISIKDLCSRLKAKGTLSAKKD